MYVCICLAVTEAEAHRAVTDGARTVTDVAARCGAGTGCGSCVEKVRALIEREALTERQQDADVFLTRAG